MSATPAREWAMKISFERGHSKRRLAGGNLKPPGPAAGHLRSFPLKPSASAARSGFFWHPPITLQAGGWSSAGLRFPQIVQAIVFVGRCDCCLLHFHPEEALRSDAHAVGHGNNTIGPGEGSAQRSPSGGEVSGVFELICLTGDCRATDDELIHSVHTDFGPGQLRAEITSSVPFTSWIV